MYLLDNESTDGTVDIARGYLNRHVIGIESLPRHAIQKYAKKDFAPEEIDNLHGWRATARARAFKLPSAREMHVYTGDDALDPSQPLSEHLLVGQDH